MRLAIIRCSYFVVRSSLLILILLAGWAVAGSCAESLGIASAERPFLEGNYDKAVKEADRLIAADANRKDELYYLKGLSQLKSGRYAEARGSFEGLLSRYPSSQRAFDARVGIGDAFFLEGNSGAASSIYSDIIQKHPGNPNIGSVHKRLDGCGRPGAQQQPAQRQAGSINKPVAYANIIPADSGQVPSAERFSVQVGSFKNRRNADNLAKKLSGRGYSSYVEAPPASGDRMYRVKVGRSFSRDEAEKIEGKLKVQGYPTRICPES